MKTTTTFNRICALAPIFFSSGVFIVAGMLTSSSVQDLFNIDDVRKAWTECDSQANMGEWELSESNTGSAVVPAQSSTIKVKLGQGQFVVSESVDGTSKQIRGLNPDYRFALGSVDDGRLKIERLFSANEVAELRKLAPDSLDTWERNMAMLGRYQGLHLFGGVSWNDLFASPSLQIRACSSFNRNGISVFQFQFDSIPNNSKGLKSDLLSLHVKNGEAVIFAKDNYFLPLEANFEVHSAERIVHYETTNTYHVEKGSIPQLEECVVRRTIDGCTDEGRFAYKTILAGVSPPDSEFRLTAFGIPEPKAAEFHASTTRWPWWVRICIGGAVFVGIAALFKRTWNKKGMIRANAC